MSSSELPEVFLLDAAAWCESCIAILPASIPQRDQLAMRLLVSIAMHLVLDTIPMASVLPASLDEGRSERVCTTVNTYASRDLSQLVYRYNEEVGVQMYQWYFQTYLQMYQELNQFFPNYCFKPDGLTYTVKLYGALLRFDRIPTMRDFYYVSDRTI